MRITVHESPNAMPAELSHDPNAFVAREFRDDRPDVTETCTLTNHRDPSIATTTRNLDDSLGVRTGLSNHKHGARIAVVPR
jgi:hypothetical protein